MHATALTEGGRRGEPKSGGRGGVLRVQSTETE